MRAPILFHCLLCAAAISACRGDEPRPTRAPQPDGAALVDRPSAGQPRVVILGDSLTAGLGLSADAAFPALLEQKLRAEGYSFDVVNAGVSGDTSAGGLRRIDWALDGDVRILVVALGANDGLRGLPVDAMKKNLSAIVERARERRIAVLLAGMESPPNFGPAYTTQFRLAYREVAREHRIRLLPFLLEGVAGRPELNQADGIHPNVDGARVVADRVFQALQSLVDEAAS